MKRVEQYVKDEYGRITTARRTVMRGIPRIPEYTYSARVMRAIEPFQTRLLALERAADLVMKKRALEDCDPVTLQYTAALTRLLTPRATTQ